MAILGKIRERSIFLIIIIGLALFAFVLTGLFDPGSPLFSQNTTSVGNVNGDNISREEFAELVEQQRARTGNRGSQLQNVNAAWDNLVREKIYKIQLEKSGVIVGEKDVWDEILKQPFIQNNPQFKNAAGFIDEEKLKEYIATLQDDATEDNVQGKSTWLSWLDYERSIKSNLELRTYNNLITAGLGATLKEGERYYMDNNTKIDLEYVFVPFSYIADSTITITDAEIKKYIKSNEDQFKTEASRDISFVKFDIKATPEDEAVISQNLATLINDREEYNKASKANMNVVGFSNTVDMEVFFREYSSDTPLENTYKVKSAIPAEVADSLFNLNVSQVYGPYKEGEYFKISKLVGVKQLPDSVKARHILIPFLGALRADPSITQSEAAAQKSADSLLSIIKRDKSAFADLAKTWSSDKVSGGKGGDLGWYDYKTMVAEFRDFTFENKVGDINVVKSAFGFHIIEIEGQKNFQKAVNIATFSRQIEPSEETENMIFQKAETFASDLADGKDIIELAKENNLTVQPVVGLKAMDDRVSTLASQRQIVSWAFNKTTKTGDIKRFDVENGYAVTKLTAKRKKGLSIGNSSFRIRKILTDQKKAALIKEQMVGNNLQELASAFKTNVNTSRAVSLGSPVLPGVGRAQDFIGSLVSLKENILYKNVTVNNGVFAAKIIRKDSPAHLDNYKSSASLLSSNVRSKSQKSYEILKKFADIEDNRAVFY